MPKVDADPEELRRFAREIRRFKADVEGQLNRLNGHLQRMRTADRQQQRFAADWDKTSRSLRAFLEAIDRYAPYLDKKATKLEEFLR